MENCRAGIAVCLLPAIAGSLFLLSACRHEEVSSAAGQVKHAREFSMQYHADGSKMLVDGDGRRLVLSPEKSLKADDAHFRIPSRRTAPFSTPAASLISALGETDSIIAVTIEKKYWFIDEIVNRMDSGAIKYLGADGGNLDYEFLYDLKPDLVLANNTANPKKLRKLQEIGVPVAVFHDYLETTPQGQAEWIRFVAAFYNREEKANQIFERIERRIQAVSERMKQVKQRPRVLWAGLSWGRVYYAGRDSLEHAYVSMGGGDYVFRDNVGSGHQPSSMEVFYLQGKEADIFFSRSMAQYGVDSVRKLAVHYPLVAGFKSVKTGNVWCYKPWFWQSLDKVDEIAEDVAAIIHPEMFPGHRIRHFERLAD